MCFCEREICTESGGTKKRHSRWLTRVIRPELLKSRHTEKTHSRASTLPQWSPCFPPVRHTGSPGTWIPAAQSYGQAGHGQPSRAHPSHRLHPTALRLPQCDECCSLRFMGSHPGVVWVTPCSAANPSPGEARDWMSETVPERGRQSIQPLPPGLYVLFCLGAVRPWRLVARSRRVWNPTERSS